MVGVGCEKKTVLLGHGAQLTRLATAALAGIAADIKASKLPVFSVGEVVGPALVVRNRSEEVGDCGDADPGWGQAVVSPYVGHAGSSLASFQPSHHTTLCILDLSADPSNHTMDPWHNPQGS